MALHTISTIQTYVRFSNSLECIGRDNSSKLFFRRFEQDQETMATEASILSLIRRIKEKMWWIHGKPVRGGAGDSEEIQRTFSTKAIEEMVECMEMLTKCTLDTSRKNQAKLLLLKMKSRDAITTEDYTFPWSHDTDQLAESGENESQPITMDDLFTYENAPKEVQNKLFDSVVAKLVNVYNFNRVFGAEPFNDRTTTTAQTATGSSIGRLNLRHPLGRRREGTEF
jgi:hypothetical protein